MCPPWFVLTAVLPNLRLTVIKVEFSGKKAFLWHCNWLPQNTCGDQKCCTVGICLSVRQPSVGLRVCCRHAKVCSANSKTGVSCNIRTLKVTLKPRTNRQTANVAYPWSTTLYLKINTELEKREKRDSENLSLNHLFYMSFHSRHWW